MVLIAFSGRGSACLLCFPLRSVVNSSVPHTCVCLLARPWETHLCPDHPILHPHHHLYSNRFHCIHRADVPTVEVYPFHRHQGSALRSRSATLFPTSCPTVPLVVAAQHSTLDDVFARPSAATLFRGGAFTSFTSSALLRLFALIRAIIITAVAVVVVIIVAAPGAVYGASSRRPHGPRSNAVSPSPPSVPCGNGGLRLDALLHRVGYARQ